MKNLTAKQASLLLRVINNPGLNTHQIAELRGDRQAYESCLRDRLFTLASYGVIREISGVGLRFGVEQRRWYPIIGSIDDYRAQLLFEQTKKTKIDNLKNACALVLSSPPGVRSYMIKDRVPAPSTRAQNIPLWPLDPPHIKPKPLRGSEGNTLTDEAQNKRKG